MEYGKRDTDGRNLYISHDAVAGQIQKRTIILRCAKKSFFREAVFILGTGQDGLVISHRQFFCFDQLGVVYLFDLLLIVDMDLSLMPFVVPGADHGIQRNAEGN